MGNYKAFTSASAVREPLVAEFDDGRRIEFPGDLDAVAYLKFASEFGDALGGPMIPLSVIPDFMRMVLSDKYDEAVNQLTMTELNEVAGWLYVQYMTYSAGDRNGDPTKALASTTSSPSGEPSRPTSEGSTS